LNYQEENDKIVAPVSIPLDKAAASGTANGHPMLPAANCVHLKAESLLVAIPVLVSTGIPMSQGSQRGMKITLPANPRLQREGNYN